MHLQRVFFVLCVRVYMCVCVCVCVYVGVHVLGVCVFWGLLGSDFCVLWLGVCFVWPLGLASLFHCFFKICKC